MIFYDTAVLATNEGLTEVTNKSFIAKLREEFRNKFMHYKSMGPLICSTFIAKDVGQKNF